MTKRIVTLLVKMGTSPCMHIIVNFVEVNIPPAYNATLKKLTLGATWFVCSPYYLKIKFLITNDGGKLLGDQSVVGNCYVHTLKANKYFPIEDLDQKDELRQKRMQPSDNVAPFTLYENDDTKVT